MSISFLWFKILAWLQFLLHFSFTFKEGDEAQMQSISLYLSNLHGKIKHVTLIFQSLYYFFVTVSLQFFLLHKVRHEKKANQPSWSLRGNIKLSFSLFFFRCSSTSPWAATPWAASSWSCTPTSRPRRWKTSGRSALAKRVRNLLLISQSVCSSDYYTLNVCAINNGTTSAKIPLGKGTKIVTDLLNST